ncbi:MAG: hypothetical protein BWY83_01824 [bacterium ADurb.Bin478]|nr:MAG: hypothetical protein BWY83_01824 [bacterium ADurb.Bin478]
MKEKREKATRKLVRKGGEFLDLAANNYKLFGLGILILIVGYFFLAQGPADSFMSLTLAPILLVFSYCVVIPYAIFWKAKKREPQK